MYTYFFHCIGSNHVHVRTHFCFKNNARRVLSSQAQGQAIQWSKEKGQSLIYKTFPPQRAMHFFTGSKNQIFIFWTLKNISSFPSNFYNKFLVENWRAGLMIFLHLSSCKLKFHHIINIFFSSEKNILKVKWSSP